MWLPLFPCLSAITVDISYFWVFLTINIYRKVIRAWQILTEGLHITPQGDGPSSTWDVQDALSRQGWIPTALAVSQARLYTLLLCPGVAVSVLPAPRASSSAMLPQTACAGPWPPQPWPASPAQEATWAWPSGSSSLSRREHRREGGKAPACPRGTSLPRVPAEADKIQQIPSRTGALPPTDLHGQNVPNPLSHVSLTLCPVQTHDHNPFSLPPSLCISLPFHHKPAPRIVLPKTYVTHRENALELTPEKTWDTEHSSASLQGLQLWCVLFPWGYTH